MYYIGTNEECQAYLDWVNDMCNFDGEATVSWTRIIKKHNSETEYAVLINSMYDYTTPNTLTLIESLPGDWFPED